ncbi:aminopeptidase N [Idiomarina xiamenensis]|uniref:Aminopeptidase N n=1 Tax=Idiomarina xiamenensis 10-D-4 TaxID=740709 RepID=K2LB43_9GAMM|nr:aminopeptidase N [Idiomarina xiamenensis]EKE87030.1 aminopeptidase N [Idiomarina xiamenensis 10-D-4]
MSTEQATQQPAAKYRKDYQAPAFRILTTTLDIDLHPQQTRVICELEIVREDYSQSALMLDGEQLTLVSLQVDGRPLSESDYQLSEQGLRIDGLPQRCRLRIENLIDPAQNKALEGLYLSAGCYCTQCEAEGFRRITYYLDRPDVLSEFTTTVRADQQQFPHLLSNGNCIDRQTLEQGRHAVTWHDPHPKPSYLFALVAGDFDLLEDSFHTQDGRDVALQLFVDKGNLDRAEHAMRSLKAAMRWDEQRFGLVYDLDIYMIVAVDFFNMGAMENKGLNVFNAKYVLVNPKTATDQNFLNVESVIGHEYFHNWTGNRITCRDWFQLSLKEGLTVFRDQEFSADMGSRAVHRINDINIMRTHQFNEDAGPMAHPIRPDKVIEMNNFYTVTVYNKGAEVIRMLHTLLGEQGFQAGMREYVSRHDGQAVTCEDFIAAMEAANAVDLQQFRRWYSQAGTPELTVSQQQQNGQLCLTVAQQTPATPQQQQKLPLHMPLLVRAYNRAGEVVELQPADEHDVSIRRSDSGAWLLSLTEAQQSFYFKVAEQPIVMAWLESFSAPVKLVQQADDADLRILMAAADDAFVRWDSAQQLYQRVIQRAVDAGNSEQPLLLTEQTVTALRQLLQADIDPALRAQALTVPTLEALLELYPEQRPVDALCHYQQALQRQIATALAADFQHCYQQLSATQGDYSVDAAAIAGRSLKQVCLHYLALSATAAEETGVVTQIQQQFANADNMTDQLAALQAAVSAQLSCAKPLLQAFDQQWRGDVLVMDKWFAVQATADLPDTVTQVQALMQHPDFSLDNPNRVYALLASFTHNVAQFHRADGAGYRLIAEVIAQLNSSNPQVASRLIGAFMQWRRFDDARQQLMREQLLRLRQLPNLARDLYEKIVSCLDE